MSRPGPKRLQEFTLARQAAQSRAARARNAFTVRSPARLAALREIAALNNPANPGSIPAAQQIIDAERAMAKELDRQGLEKEGGTRGAAEQALTAARRQLARRSSMAVGAGAGVACRQQRRRRPGAAPAMEGGSAASAAADAVGRDHDSVRRHDARLSSTRHRRFPRARRGAAGARRVGRCGRGCRRRRKRVSDRPGKSPSLGCDARRDRVRRDAAAGAGSRPHAAHPALRSPIGCSRCSPRRRAVRPPTWPTNVHHVRAQAEPLLNAWAATLLPRPAQVRCKAAYVDPRERRTVHTSGGRARRRSTSHRSTRCISRQGRDQAQRSELEQRLAFHLLRTRAGVSACRRGCPFELRRATRRWTSDVVSVGEFLETARTARALIAGSRAVDGRDLSLPGASTGIRARDRRARAARREGRRRARSRPLQALRATGRAGGISGRRGGAATSAPAAGVLRIPRIHSVGSRWRRPGRPLGVARPG